MAGVLAMSIFGALQIAALVCARIPYAMARDGMFFSSLGTLSPRTHVRFARCVVQGAWAIVLVLSGSFDTLTDYAIFSVLIFVALGRHRCSSSGAACRTPSARTGRGAIRSCRCLFLLVYGMAVINTLLTTPGRALSRPRPDGAGPAVLLVLVAHGSEPGNCD